MKNPVKKMATQASDWEKIFVNHILGKGLGFRIFKDLLKLSIGNPNNPVKKKMDKDLVRPFLPKKI